MVTAEIWSATMALATVWRTSALVQELRGVLPRNNSNHQGITEVLSNIDASYGLVSAEPLVPNKWALYAPQSPFVNLTDRSRDFLNRMDPIGFASELTTAWLRSRIPGYPLIPVPQLAANTDLTTAELNFGIGWRREALQAGLQYESAPRGAAELLGVDGLKANSAAQRVATCLEMSHEWLVFGELLGELHASDRQELQGARRKIKPLLSEVAVNAFEPDRMLRRSLYRKERVEEAVGVLTGRSLELALAFDEVCDLINFVSVEVFGQIVAYGAPLEVSQVHRMERVGDIVTFESNQPIPRSALIHVDHPLASDCALVIGSEFSFGEATGTVSTYKARVLVDSSNLN